jgi:hypothetical protein
VRPGDANAGARGVEGFRGKARMEAHSGAASETQRLHTPSMRNVCSLAPRSRVALAEDKSAARHDKVAAFVLGVTTFAVSISGSQNSSRRLNNSL